MPDETSNPPNRRSIGRKAFYFLLAFVISLGIGRAFQYLTAPTTLQAAYDLQQGWFNSASTMAPLSLASNYFDDVLVFASKGTLAGVAVPNIQPAAKEISRQKSMPAGQKQCRLIPFSRNQESQTISDPVPVNGAKESNSACRALSLLKKACLPGIVSDPYDECVAEQEQIRARFEQECAGWTAENELRIQDLLGAQQMEAARREAEQQQPRYTPGGVGRVLGAPIFALFHTWTRLTVSGGISYFWAVLQLGTGLIGFLALYGPVFGDRRRQIYMPEGVWGWVVGVPIGTIAVASVTAMILKYVMLFGLYLFCQVTSLAALCCASMGTLGICWWWFSEIAKFSAGAALTPKDPQA